MQNERPSPPAAGAKDFPLGFKEFVALIAGLMAMNALSIDPMLPALPAIGESLGIHNPNDRQWIITAYFMGLGVGALFYGSLSDRYGRRPVLLICLGLMLVTTMVCALAPSFAVMLVARAFSGFFAAAMRVIAVSIVRDRFQGDAMARVMSLVFVVFMLVPILAPTFGQIILFFAPWRWIFGVLLVLSCVILIWTAIRLPETLDPAHRVEIHARDIGRMLWTVVSHRTSIGYMLATGVAMGGMIGFLTSAQQIFFDIFHAPGIFPIAFASIAGGMAVGSFFNSQLVERIGARRVSQSALIVLIMLGAIHTMTAWLGMETMISFIIFQVLTMLVISLTGSNFGAISMEPFARGAGLASSFQAFVTTIVSAGLGAFIGAQFNGTTLPMALGFLGYGSLALLLVAWAERWKLFTRPHHGALRNAAH
ncbi:multidrug effflux MFS transporter [Sphingobium phenoxybenzoativorans]|uniref:Bcr/CflA family efflux transporter n=1 Tax=Sphingobium phenoxybenzoativorans TaxID=1592790 RepID=A0A975K7R2_9SPHN|nr:multidrug effflux MFS transporter [Sphingobium phenoxybenzoativorans]QUT06344.1 multidrug effflux MFS transporter [Sphingobium phenoxybenzoativorans]